MNVLKIKWKWIFVSSVVLIFVVKGIGYFIFPEQQLPAVKAFCINNKEIQQMTGGVDSITLAGRTKYWAAPNEISYMEYKLNVYGKRTNIFAIIKVEYPNGFNFKPGKYKILETIKPQSVFEHWLGAMIR